MMIREDMEILSHELVADKTYKMTLKGDMPSHVIQPGQFVHILIDSSDSLRRPISIADVDLTSGTLTILYKVLGKGTASMAEKPVGEHLDVLGPGGNGYPIEEVSASRALLVGGGIGVPPLYYLAKQLKEKGIDVTTVLGFQHADAVFFEDEFRELGEVIVATNDGSYGSKGFVTDILPSLDGRFDTYFSCGPAVMLKAVSETLDDFDGYLSIEERLGCGVGACFACVVPAPEGDAKGYRKICRDGPVFRTGEVIL
ncbi:dihydroorotate dehydrogenase electron transfer subunit [Thalassobacillus cyri]|uniref:Dihydroorotate dehydrogenase B (NAD(+)), electron transfer subunit n=1 Tax=Thalassobacillus cyri TaxID=571932 RepID=A0A1H4H902_9BACI|nr:dihydroorotate dehydrogenase electron transfer subunit [Thalassobacillus cyri]SEB17558.1 dihydroorotate dehydrogenase electron transfer subunit [Thalassobacillus cyri]